MLPVDNCQPYQDLQKLPGAPWDIDENGSRGRPFTLPPLPIFKMDIPVDPVVNSIWTEKITKRDTASIGDFVPYQLTVTNSSPRGLIEDVRLEDRLPKGFRYVKGSARVDDVKTEPTLSEDGRTLTFTFGVMDVNSSRKVTYVTEVAAGSREGKAINSAVAIAKYDLRSNIAKATVSIEDEFMRNVSFIAGRVMAGPCNNPDQELEGVSGIRIYLEDGTYVVTDENGRYHIEAVEPGTHVVQLDPDTYQDKYEVVVCEPSTQFAGVGWSQFLDLRPATMGRANFHLRTLDQAINKEVSRVAQKTSEGTFDLGLRAELSEDQKASLEVPFEIGQNPVNNLRVSIILSPGSEYVAGSSTLEKSALEDPQQMAVVLNYHLGDMEPNSKHTLNLKVRIPDNVKGDEVPFKAIATIDTESQKSLRTQPITTVLKRQSDEFLKLPEITMRPEFPTFGTELSSEDIQRFNQMAEQLKGMVIEQVVLTGHTDNQPIAERSQHLYANNHELSIGRAESVANYLGKILDIPRDKMLISGAGDSLPLSSNETQEGRQRNRRVEMRLIALKSTTKAAQTISEAQATPLHFTDERSTSTDESLSDGSTDNGLEQAVFDDEYVKTISDGYDWIWPPERYYPPIGSIQIAIKHDPKHRAEVSLNDSKVSPLNFEGVRSNPQRSASLSLWKGVDILDGDNSLTVEIIDSKNNIVSSETRVIHLSTPPVEANLIKEESYLFADGIKPAILAVQLLDITGHPARKGLNGEFRISEPYEADRRHTSERDIENNNHKLRYLIEDDGIARFAVSPTTQAGEIELVLRLADGDEVIKAWLSPQKRDWILVGFAEGTVGYNKLSGNQVSLEEAGIDEHYYDDGRVKFFAKGAVKGDWLLTMAYDSDKPNLDGDILHQIIDPDSYYPLYGDTTKQGYEAASARDIYIKLEKDQAYAVFGDMETGLNKTELGQYNRNLNGIKVANETEHYSITAFAAQTKQTFAKDEILGDGTSGRYQLSNNNIVINSEQIIIETRGRLHSQSILKLQTLTRHSDYEIDYNTGTLYFKQPIPSKDEDFNPVYIVVRYEVEGSSGENDVYGARAAMKLLDQRVEIGATYVHEEKDDSDGNLYAIDSWIELSDKVKLHIEAARTETETLNGASEGNAYIAELDYESNENHANIYYREQEDGFGLGQQNESEDGTRKYGLKAESQLTPQVSVDAELFHEEKLSTDAERNVAEVGASYAAPQYKVRSGIRQAEDTLDDGSKQQSTQALVGVDINTSIKGVTLNADFEQSLDNNNESQAYPTLLRAGADYKVSERVRLFANQEFTWGNENDTQATTAGIALTPWDGGTVETSLEQNLNENGERMFALLGLGQNWSINKNWSIDASIDRSQTIKSVTADSVNDDAAPAHGTNEDFTSVSVGATYTSEKWSWSNRLETRQADSEMKYGATTRVVTQVNPDIAVSAKASVFINDLKNGNDSEDGTITLGMAYRPDDSRWIILQRFDLEFENTQDFSSKRIINHIHANWYMNRRVQFSLYSGVKYVYDTIDGQNYDGVTDMHAAEARYNINSRWDIGFYASWLHSWNGQAFDYAAGVSVGYLVRTNTWVSLGYNFKGFEDSDFSTAQYTAQGPYMKFRMKFDQQSVKEAAEWLNKD